MTTEKHSSHHALRFIIKKYVDFCLILGRHLAISPFSDIKFSEMLRVNMQMTHYVVKYALICMHFQSMNVIIGSSQVHNSCFQLVDI